MADPATLFLAAATTMQAVGAIRQGNAAAASYKTQQQAAEYNAAVSRNQADLAGKVSSSEQNAQNRKARQVLGLQRAAAAQSGLGFSGTNQDMIERSGTLAELDQLNLAYEGATRARGFMGQADLDEFNARVAGVNARSAKRAGYFGAATAVANAGYQYSKQPRSTVT